MLPPSGASFILGLKHPVVSGPEIISEGTKHWRLSVCGSVIIQNMSPVDEMTRPYSAADDLSFE